MRLSKRLETIFNMVPPGVAADVGADHGHLIIALIEENKISHGIAIENKKGPFNRLKKSIEEHCLTNEIDVILSDGIKDINSEVNTVILAGMGGNTIINILKSDISKLKYIDTIIVDAHSCVPKLRKEVCELGYAIADEKIVFEDNIYYEIIKFKKADKAVYSPIDIEFGPILRNEKSTLFKAKYSSRLEEIENLLRKDLPNNKIEALKIEESNIRGIL
ncbi:MAG: class I SAM-dependent methyltransferase [Bacilli bacterium]|nr:class I SAM-dependent methyltransferase [Bacilli bacterium]